MDIKTVTVLGANGTMGKRVSAIFASFGGAKVYMVSRDREKSEKAVEKACLSVRAGSIKDKLIPAGYDMLGECVPDSDLIFECVKEDIDVKLSVASMIAPLINDSALVCFGTSGLSIKRLSEAYYPDVRRRCFGVHMFNPPYSLPLCELTATEYSDMETHKLLRDYLSGTLLRTVVEVRDRPAFLANRIGFQFMNEALICAENYADSGGIDYIDSILGSYTGRIMPPLLTSNFVGLDVHKAIVDNIYANTDDYAHESFKLPSFADSLIKKGMLGVKTGGGLYKTEYDDSGAKRKLVYDISSGNYRGVINYSFPYVEHMREHIRTGDYKEAFRALTLNHSQEAKICKGFLARYILYALSTARDIGFDIGAADDVMACGFNWCPPLALIEALSSAADIKSFLAENAPVELSRVEDADGLLRVAGRKSRYDHRPFFRSTR